MNPRGVPFGFLAAGMVLFAMAGLVQERAQAGAADTRTVPFYIYREFRSPDNHFVPSGWMGDYGDIRLEEGWRPGGSKESKTAIHILYTAKASQRNGWAGIYWQNPPNNWGSRPGGYNLNGRQRLVFKARGEKGGEVVEEFKIGGITGDYADSGSASLGPVTLARDWQEYAIDLQGQELSSIAGGFCWTITRDRNPNGASFYLDDIRYE